LVDDEGEEDAVFELESESEEYDGYFQLRRRRQRSRRRVGSLVYDLCCTPLLDNNIVDLSRHAND
jgi:hypothetical protein